MATRSFCHSVKEDTLRYLERAAALEPQNDEFRGALTRLRSGTLSR